MTRPVSEENRTLILIDAKGNVTEDRAKAVRGEILERLPDGSTRSTLFEIDKR